MRSSRSKQDEEESFLSARDQHVEDGEGDLSDDGGGGESDGNYSDNEAFLSARENNSDWYRGGKLEESEAMNSARTDQFWTPRADGFAPPIDPACTFFFQPELMPKEFEKIFSKTRHGKHKEVEQMFDDGAPVDGQDPYGNTVLHTACQNGNKRILKACLRRGANTNAQNVRGHTPLHFCYAYGYGELGEYLVAKGGADQDIRNVYGLTCYEGLGIKTPLTGGKK